LTESNRESRPLALLNRSLAVTTVLAALIVAAVFWLGARSKSDDAWVRHSLEVRGQLTRILSLVQSTETGQRGYLLTGQELYLGPYKMAVEQLPMALQRTKDLVSDNPEQERSLADLSDLIARKLAELKSTVDAYDAGNKDMALAIVNSDNGFRLMQEIRRLVEDMRAKEDRWLADRQSLAARSETMLQAGVALAFLLVGESEDRDRDLNPRG
jgi:CHASE3 domain sensor protein